MLQAIKAQLVIRSQAVSCELVLKYYFKKNGMTYLAIHLKFAKPANCQSNITAK